MKKKADTDNTKSLPAKATKASISTTEVNTLLASLRGIIREARQQVVRSVDQIQVRTGWEVGRHIVEFEQGGTRRAEYGARLLPRLAEKLTAEFGKGFDASNLYKMSQFYRLFPILDALRPELSWTHYRSLLRVEDPQAREWYMNEAAAQNYSKMDMYVRMYDDKRCGPEDNPTVGVILCANKDETVVRYSVLSEHKRLFATRYKLVLPSENELRAELIREQKLLADTREDKP